MRGMSEAVVVEQVPGFGYSVQARREINLAWQAGGIGLSHCPREMPHATTSQRLATTRVGVVVCLLSILLAPSLTPHTLISERRYEGEPAGHVTHVRNKVCSCAICCPASNGAFSSNMRLWDYMNF